MTRAKAGNRRGLWPARMVGLILWSKRRWFGRDANRVQTGTSRGSHGRLPLFLLFFFTQTAVPYTFASPELNTKFRPPQRQHTAIISSEELAAAQGLETLLFEQAIQEMRKTVPENDLMPLSQSERIFRQMLDSEYAKLLSKNQALGIAELIIAQLYNKR